MKDCKKVLLSILLIPFSLVFSACSSSSNESASPTNETKDPNRTIVVGIAWKCDDKPKVYEAAISAIKTAGATVKVLDKVTSLELAYNEDGTLADAMIDGDGELSYEAAQIVKNKNYDKTNVETAVSGVDAVIFLGGEDISPSLQTSPEPVIDVNEDNINPTRDVSDYITMSYLLEKDIPIMGICRGMQMLAIVSGGSLIQDIPLYYEMCGAKYNYYHRMMRDSEGNIPDFTPHNVDIIDNNSIIYNIVKTSVIEDLPSWHHQSVDISGATALKVTGTSTDAGITMPEIIERTDKTYAIGYQFHPEAVIDKLNNQGNVFDYTSIITINALFDSLIENAR